MMLRQELLPKEVYANSLKFFNKTETSVKGRNFGAIQAASLSAQSRNIEMPIN